MCLEGEDRWSPPARKALVRIRSWIVVCLVVAPALGLASTSVGRSDFSGFVAQLSPQLAKASAGHQTILVRARTKAGATSLAAVRVGKVTQDLSRIKAGKAGKVGWRWVIIPTSPSGKWTITVSCQKGRQRGLSRQSVLVVTPS